LSGNRSSSGGGGAIDGTGRDDSVREGALYNEEELQNLGLHRSIAGNELARMPWELANYVYP
jgi:hypothetical protein